MDIQLFENFALPPDSRMEIEIHENFSLPPGDQDHPNTSSTKRAGDPALVDERPLKRAHLSESDLTEDVKALVEYYQLNEFQEEILIKRAKEHKFVFTVEQVEWVVEEAKLREDHPRHKINLVMFAYMEYYPWYLRSLGDDHRVFIGAIDTWRSHNELWVSFNGKKSQLHWDSPRPGESKDVLRLPAVFRRYVKWLASFDDLFQLGLMKSEKIDDHARAKNFQEKQSAYIKAAMKVLARFPGLILERHPDPGKPMVRIQLYQPKWSAFPFKANEADSPENPLGKLFGLLTTKPEKSETPKKTAKSKASKKSDRKVIESDESDEEDLEEGKETGEGEGEEYLIVDEDEDEDLMMGDG
ncbi:hypothetical protein KCU65_g8883, partial [Aureobasidium melanogenum]